MVIVMKDGNEVRLIMADPSDIVMVYDHAQWTKDWEQQIEGMRALGKREKFSFVLDTPASIVVAPECVEGEEVQTHETRALACPPPCRHINVFPALPF